MIRIERLVVELPNKKRVDCQALHGDWLYGYFERKPFIYDMNCNAFHRPTGREWKQVEVYAMNQDSVEFTTNGVPKVELPRVSVATLDESRLRLEHAFDSLPTLNKLQEAALIRLFDPKVSADKLVQYLRANGIENGQYTQLRWHGDGWSFENEGVSATVEEWLMSLATE